MSGYSSGTGKANGIDLEDFDPMPLITGAFAPHVPIIASEDANELARSKGFKSLFDLLRPFAKKVESKVTIRDSQGVSTIYEDFNLVFVELPPVAPLLNLGQVGTPGKSGNIPTVTYLPGGDLGALERKLEHELEKGGEDDKEPMSGISSSIGYYTMYIKSLLSGFPTSPHESFAHPVASLIAISSHNTSPIESLVSLYNSSSNGLPHFVDGSFLRYYVLVHDEDEHDLELSLQLFERMKRSFGLHCHLLRLGSKKVSENGDSIVPVPSYDMLSAPEILRSRWLNRENSFVSDLACQTREEVYLSQVDSTSLSALIREMVVQSIVPYMERQIQTWNDQVGAYLAYT